MGRRQEMGRGAWSRPDRNPPLTGLTHRAMLAPSGVAGTDQPRSHLRVTPLASRPTVK